MSLVVLDGYTLNPGDLSWEELKKTAGGAVVYDRTPKELIVERAKDAELVLTNKTPLTAETIKQLPKLRYIGVLATGYDVVDVAAAAERGIVVTNIPAYSTDSVAQLVFALLLELCHHAGLHNEAVRGMEWSNQPDFCFWKTPLVELKGKTFGIIGYGTIGEQTAQIAAAFGMRVLAHNRSRKGKTDLPGFAWAEMEEILAEADVVSLHCPLTDETAGMINKETIAKMKKTAFLINTARGKLIVEEDLADALNEGRIAGAGLDVLSSEPPEPDNPLLRARNCVITPHIAWATKEARSRLMETAVLNVSRFLAGDPIHQVN